MAVFTDQELAYLAGQRLGRLATVGANGEPHVVPVGFRHNPVHDSIDIGGHAIDRTKKYRDVTRNGRVAFVVDDLASTDPWRVRGIEIRGQATVSETGGRALGPGFDAAMIRITPERIVVWGIGEADPFARHARSVDPAPHGKTKETA